MADKLPTESVPAGETVYVLSPLAETSTSRVQGVPLADLILGVWRRRVILAVVTVLGGLLGFGMARLGPERYEATSTLFVQPPQFSSELKPAALSAEAYEKLLNADYTVGRVRAELVNDKVLSEGVTIPELKGMISTSIPQAETQRILTSLPMIEVTARTGDAEKSERISNTVARVFAQMSRDVSTQGQQGALQLIESQYPTTLERLQHAVEEERERRDHYARALQSLTRRWDRRISDYNLETQQLVADYQRETDRMTLDFERLRQPDLLKAQLESNKARLVALQGEFEDIQMRLKSSEYALAEVDRLLKDQPEKIMLEQVFLPWWLPAPPGGSEGPDKISVESETTNNTRSKLMDKFVETSVEVETLRPRASDLDSETARVQAQVEAMSLKVMQLRLDELDLTQKRETGLAVLKRKRSEGLEELTLAREGELADFQRARDLELSNLSRKATTAESTFKVIAEKFESARLAKSEQEPDVKIFALALRPESPISRGTAFKTALGLVSGFLLAFFCAALAEVLSVPTAPRREPSLSRAQLEGHRDRRLARS